MSDQEREALKAALGVMEQAVSEMGPAARTQNSMLIGERADDMIAAMRPCIRKARAALAAREKPQAEEMLRLPGTPSKSWRGGGTMGRRRSRMSEPTTALGDQGDGEPSETRQALIRRAAQAMWEAGPTTHRGGWEDLTERQQEFACHEARAAVDVALAARGEPPQTLIIEALRILEDRTIGSPEANERAAEILACGLAAREDTEQEHKR